jgi:hypothetical protein
METYQNFKELLLTKIVASDIDFCSLVAKRKNASDGE